MNNKCDKYFEALNKKISVELLSKDFFSNKTLAVQEVIDGIVVPPVNFKFKSSKKYNPENTIFGAGGVIEKNGKYVDISAQKAYGMRQRIAGVYDISDSLIASSNESVIYMNYFIHQWGHYLLDVIGRLWYALREKKLKIVYTCYTDRQDEINGNYLELLNLLGIPKDRLLLINKPTAFKKIIVPESAIYPGKYYTNEYKQMFDLIVSNAGVNIKSDNKKIYCSRAKLGKANKREFGEKLVEKVFNANGYESVYMEQLSLIEQIKLFNSCSEIALVNGSLAHNLLFVKNNCNVYILNKTYRYNLHQYLINQFSNINATFVDVYVSPLPVLYGYGPFIIRITSEFIKFCSDHNINIDIKTIDNSISFGTKIKYYFEWLYAYKRFLITGKKIQEDTINEEIPRKVIRKFYKYQLINLPK